MTLNLPPMSLFSRSQTSNNTKNPLNFPQNSAAKSTAPRFIPPAETPGLPASQLASLPPMQQAELPAKTSGSSLRLPPDFLRPLAPTSTKPIMPAAQSPAAILPEDFFNEPASLGVPKVVAPPKDSVSQGIPSLNFAADRQLDSKNLAINGFGRIGRTAFRVWWQRFRDQTPLTVINTSGSSDLETWAHLLKYDSNYGVFPAEITVNVQQTKDQVTDENPVLGTITIQGHTITVLAQRDPAKIPWDKYGVHTVVESTGKFVTQESASAHLQAGAQRVIVSAPPKGEGEKGGMEMTLLGVQEVLPSGQVLSNASCTTNCVAPVAAVMHERFGVEKAMLTTIHAYTDDQNLHDNSHKDVRRARAAALNIVPTSTGAAKAVGSVIPKMAGKFDGLAVRVPVAVGSLSDMVFVTSRDVSVNEVNMAFESAALQSRWSGILAVTNEALVSSDIVGRSESAIVDLSLTQVVGGNLVKVVAWYDNEFGYCNRLLEVAVLPLQV